MKQTIKGIIIGVIVTLTVISPVQAFAKTGKVNLEAYYNNIKIMLNGNYVNLVDESGKSVEPFVVNGVTYLPVRTLGETLGIPTSWDAKTATVILGKKPNGEGTSLTELGVFSGDYKENYSFKKFSSFETNVGEKYYDGYTIAQGGEADATFLLNGQYDSFEFALAPYKNCRGKEEKNLLSDGRYSFRVYGDDKLIYELDELPSDLINPIKVSLNVDNITRLKIVAPGQNDGYGYASTYIYGILNPKVY